MMNRARLMVVVLAGAALQLAVPAAMPASGDTGSAGKKDRPAKVEAIPGSKVKQVTVTEKAAKRLDIQTGTIASDGSGRLTAPYSAVVYDIEGGAWVYTVPKPMTYVRQAVVIEAIKGEQAHLKQGPPAGTTVVTVGVAELYGTEKGLGY